MNKFISAMILCCAFFQVHAQDYVGMIRNNPAMGAANMMNYHYENGGHTPAPKGYNAFYISHYGRHGSRYHSSDLYAVTLWPVMRKADSLGLLTEAGKAFYKDFNAVMEEQVGMYGMLTTLGAQEQRGIAERMAANFPSVFRRSRKRTKIVCQSSAVPRCLVSMTNFAHSLDRHTDEADFVFLTGEKYSEYLARHLDQNPAVRLSKVKEDSLRRATMKPMEIIAHFFTDTTEICGIAGDPYRLEADLYHAACVGHLTDCGADLLAHFPDDILIRNWEVRNARFYVAFGMAKETEDIQKTISRSLVADFVDRAESAVRDDSEVMADFRFGHDTSLLPLAGHIGIEGMDGRPDFGQVNSVWNSSVSICMGSNLQMVFFRNKSGDVIVKILYNEKETRIPALVPVYDIFYRWSDLRDHLAHNI